MKGDFIKSDENLLPLRGVSRLGGLLGGAPPGLVLAVPGNRLREALGEVGVGRLPAELAVFVSSSGFQLRQRFFSHVARKGFRFGKGVPLSLFGFAS